MIITSKLSVEPDQAQWSAAAQWRTPSSPRPAGLTRRAQRRRPRLVADRFRALEL